MRWFLLRMTKSLYLITINYSWSNDWKMNFRASWLNNLDFSNFQSSNRCLQSFTSLQLEDCKHRLPFAKCWLRGSRLSLRCNYLNCKLSKLCPFWSVPRNSSYNNKTVLSSSKTCFVWFFFQEFSSMMKHPLILL